MLRALAIAAMLIIACRKDPDLEPMHPKSGELPPLPPASGTPIGYLLDAKASLELRDDQVAKLKELDASLAAQNDAIDTQLRQIERPEMDEPAEKGAPPARRNMAPGVGMTTTPDAQKLHNARKSNDRDALTRVFKLLDPKQIETAKKILEERGVEAPGTAKPKPDDHSEDGQPLPGGDEGMPPGEP